MDIINGGSGNDTFIADNTSATEKQLSVADQLDGGAGVNTLKVYLAAADTATGQPTLTNIQNVFVNGGAVTTYTAATGTTSLTVEAPVAGTIATYTVNGQAVTLKDVLTANNTALTTTVAQAATATATSQTITLNGVKGQGTGIHSIDANGAKITTLNLNSTGAASTVTLLNTGAGITTLNIAGDKAISITESLAGIKTVNATTATGAVSLDVSGVTVDKTFAFTGGSGNDVVTVKAGNLAAVALTSGAQFDFGAGIDTLVINDTTPVYSAINAMKNLDVVQMGVTAGTFDMALLTANKVSFGAVALGTVANMEAVDSVTATGAMTTSLTLGGAVGNSAATLNVGTATTAGFTIASLVTTGLTDITVTSNGTNAAANVITGMTNSENSKFTITGSNDLTMTLTAAAVVTGSKVDAAAFTGKLNVTATNQADVINGGSGNDTIWGGKMGDIINVGTGADTIGLKAGAGAGGGDSATFAAPATNTISTAGMDIITGMGAGDKIQLLATAYSGNAGAAAGLIANGTTANTLVGLTLVDNGVEIVRGTYSAGTFVGSATGADSMVIVDTDATLTTTAFEAIVLVGFNAASVTGIGGNAGLITLA